MLKHTHDRGRPHRRLGLTIGINVGITAAEFVGGLLTGYLALLADAVHNLSDVAALVVAYFGELGAGRGPTKKSTYGLKRLEVVTASLSAAFLVVIALYIFYEAYHRLLEPTVIRNMELIIVVAVIGLAGNIASVVILNPSRKHSLNIKTAFLHMFYDTVSSMAVILGAIAIAITGWRTIDPILSVLIGLAIIGSSISILREATVIFMEGVPARLDFDQVRRAIAAHPQVKDVHDLHIWSLSSNSVALSCHISLSEDDYLSGPEVIGELSRMLHDDFRIAHSTIQPEREVCVSGDLSDRGQRRTDGSS